MMPASIQQGRLLTRCETCGGSASFGFGTQLRRAMAAKENGQIELAKKHLGIWHCGPDKTCSAEKQKENAA